jgi:hypothetical protein
LYAGTAAAGCTAGGGTVGTLVPVATGI